MVPPLSLRLPGVCVKSRQRAFDDGATHLRKDAEALPPAERPLVDASDGDEEVHAAPVRPGEVSVDV